MMATHEALDALVRDGFEVMVYCADDPVAAALHQLLDVHGDDRLVLDDEDTRAGLLLDLRERFGDEAWLTDMVGAQRAFTDVVDQGGTSVVCAQGDVIPGMLAWLSAQGTLPIDTDIHAKKGSVWVLSFSNGQLTGADYIPSALPVL